ncbi:hypothetical protein DFS34DRAFT_648100 [Phlyctochytrium arcticum]|nr:hypothetical protein DFS34DRAFT_648100 [Phlyctochytrium arcticum]
MTDEGPVPRYLLRRPRWPVGRAPSYPVLYGLDRAKVPPALFEESLPFGTVVAVQANLHNLVYENQHTRAPVPTPPSSPKESAPMKTNLTWFTQCPLLLPSKFWMRPGKDVVHGMDAHAVEAGEASLNEL